MFISKQSYQTIKLAYQTVKLAYQTVKRAYQTVKRAYQTVKRAYQTVKRAYQTVKRAYQTVKLALKYSLKDLRSSGKGFRIFIICLMLGVASLTTVGLLSAAIEAGIKADGSKLLGGDAELISNQTPIDNTHLSWLKTQSDQISNVITMRAMAYSENKAHKDTNDPTLNNPISFQRLVELKAIDDFYPLYGQLILDQEMDIASSLAPDADGRFGAVAESALALQLHLKNGDEFSIGKTRFILKGIIETQPDRPGRAVPFGPTVLINQAALDQSELVQPGSLVRYRYRLTLPQTQTAAKLKEAFNQTFPNFDYRLRGPEDATDNISRFVERTRIFLTFVGLSSILLAGIGAGIAITAFIMTRIKTIAIIKSMGASDQFIIYMHLFQAIILAFIGSISGIILGAIAASIVAPIITSGLPVTAQIQITVAPLLLTAGFAFLTTLIFSLPPLFRTKHIKPILLFRSLNFGQNQSFSRFEWVVLLMLILAIVGLAILTAQDKKLALYFALGTCGIIILLKVLAYSLISLSKVLANKNNRINKFYKMPNKLRMTFASIARPNSMSSNLVLALGLGFSILVAIAQVEANLDRFTSSSSATSVPWYYLIDIHTSQVEKLTELVQDYEGVKTFASAPMLRGRIVSMKGIPVEEIEAPSQYAWILRGDRGLTWSMAPPSKESKIVEGQWWPEDYSGEQLMSFDIEAAKAFGLKVGDQITLSILGRKITAKIANLREIDWSNFGINFVIIFSPGLISAAPQSHIMTVNFIEDIAYEKTLAIEGAIVREYPNVTAIRVRELLEGAQTIVQKLIAAIRVMTFISIIIGILVLTSILLASQPFKIKENTILKVFGASPRYLISMQLIEYSILGFMTAAAGGLCGTIAGLSLITWVMKLDFQIEYSWLWSTLIFTLIITIFIGLMTGWRNLSYPSALHLRNS